MNKIFLVGYMGAGKTTAAKRLANRLGWEVADTDAMFEEKYRISVDDFFQKYDEPLYRKLESKILKSTEKSNDNNSYRVHLLTIFPSSHHIAD